MSALNAASRRFLDHIFGDASKAWLVVGRHDAKDKLVMVPGKEGPAGTFGLPEDADQYYCIGTVGPGGRTNIQRVHALVIDDVGKEIDEFGFRAFFPLKGIWRESSAGSHQVVVKITGGMEPDEFRALRMAMKADPIWGDAHNVGAAAIYRLPQGTHTKSTRGGFKPRDVEWNDDEYTPEEIWKALAPAGALKALPKGSAADRIPAGGLLADLLALIPNDQRDWDRLVNVGRAVWGASGGLASEEYHAWAAKYPGNDPAITQGRWDSYHDASIGRFWLLREARAADPAGVEAWLALEAAATFAAEPGAAVPGDDGEDAVMALQRDVANQIAEMSGDRVRYNVSTGLWHLFDGSIWQESPHPLGFRLAKRWADQHAPSLGTRHRENVSKAAFYAGVEKILQAEEGIAVVKTDFDRDDWLLGTPGGTVDLKTGKLRGARAAEMISLSTSVVPAETEDCPRWLRFIDWACSDPATGKVDRGMVRTLKQWAGYCLTGDVSQEMVMFFHGDGANGKGTFIETMQRVLGSYFYLATKDLFMETKHGPHEEEIAVLAGRRMVAADEVPVSARWNESLLKAVSGGGMMTARHLYGRVFEFPIKFKVTISGNSKPRLQGTVNEAMERRLHMAAFRMTARPKDPAVKKAVIGEAAGVLRWALNGLQDMLSSPGGGMFIADSMDAATEEYFKESDAFGQWLAERTEPSPGNDAPAGKLFEDWQLWSGAQGGGRGIDTHKKFKAEMVKRGYIWDEKRLGSIYKDLAIRVF